MALKTRKLWLGLGVAAAAVGAHQSAGLAAAPQRHEGMSAKDFSRALDLVLAGEGGEGGLGVVYREGAISIPALSGPQIVQALSGNTLRQGDNVAAHFGGRETFSGWQVKWDEVELARCASGDPTFEKGEDGICYHRTYPAISGGTWAVRDDKVCVAAAAGSDFAAQGCLSVFLVLSDIVLFDASGKMVGKPYELLKGAKLGRKAD